MGAAIPIAGAVAGAAANKLFGGGSQTQTQTMDPASQAYWQQYRRLATQRALGIMNGPSMTPGVDPMTQQALGQMGRYGQMNPAMMQALGGYGQAASNLGFGSQTGMGNIGQYMDPYIGQVVNATNAQWDRSGQMAMNAANDMATRQGAFGGSRSAIMQGTALGQNELNRNQQIAGLYSQGYGQAADQLMAERARMANLGLAGVGGQAGIGDLQKQYQLSQIQGLLGGGDYLRQVQQQQMMDPYMRAQMGLGLMQPGLGGTMTTQTNTQSVNPLSSAVGGAMAAQGLFGNYGQPAQTNMVQPGGGWLPGYTFGGPPGGYFPGYPR